MSVSDTRIFGEADGEGEVPEAWAGLEHAVGLYQDLGFEPQLDTEIGRAHV